MPGAAINVELGELWHVGDCKQPPRSSHAVAVARAHSRENDAIVSENEPSQRTHRHSRVARFIFQMSRNVDAPGSISGMLKPPTTYKKSFVTKTRCPLRLRGPVRSAVGQRANRMRPMRASTHFDVESSWAPQDRDASFWRTEVLQIAVFAANFVCWAKVIERRVLKFHLHRPTKLIFCR